LRYCSCGGDQLFAICASAGVSTARAATDIGAGASVVATDPVTSLPLVQCSRHSPGSCGLAFPAIVAQWLETGSEAASGVSRPVGSSVNAHACAANAHCIPNIPISVIAAIQRREVRRMAKLKHIPSERCATRGREMRCRCLRVEPDQAFSVVGSRNSAFGPKLAGPKDNHNRGSP